MFQTGYHATGYYATGYYLPVDGVVQPPVQEPDSYPGGGDYAVFPTREDRMREAIERDDVDIIQVIVAGIESGIIK